MIAEIIWLLMISALIVVALRYDARRLAAALVLRDLELARSVAMAARIRRTWPATSRHLGLALADRAGYGLWRSRPAVRSQAREKVIYRPPRMRVCSDRYGVQCVVRTRPGIGLDEFQRHADHLAEEWLAARVAVTAAAPGWLRIRAVRVDPLAEPHEYDPATPGVSPDLTDLELGIDEYGEQVRLRLSGVSGIAVAGLPGYGKTSLLLGLIARLAPSAAVQFVVLDGKVDDPASEGDYADVADRLAVAVGDDLQVANDVLAKLVELRRARSKSIRAILGVVNMWHVGPSPDWPLLVVIIDEGHTYFAMPKSTATPEAKRRAALADENARLVEDLIKKGRSVGIETVVATQKQTGDAIPTFIRDVCAVSLAFACRTAEAAKAALGDDIRDYPDANPVTLQDPAYIGVCSMAVEGRRGYTRVRTPYVPAVTAAAVASATSSLCGRRGELPSVPDLAMIGAGADSD